MTLDQLIRELKLQRQSKIDGDMEVVLSVETDEVEGVAPFSGLRKVKVKEPPCTLCKRPHEERAQIMLMGLR